MVRSRSRAVMLVVLGLGLAGLTAEVRGDDKNEAILAQLRRAADASVTSLRRAAEVWNERNGPKRQVVDQVCLVPDVATFFEAIATWDEGHWFPILIEDVDLTLKFLHAFRPARVIRYPRRVASIPANRLWDAAVAAVGGSWDRNGSETAASALRGDAVAARLGPLPPGVVVSPARRPDARRCRGAGRRAIRAPGALGYAPEVRRRALAGRGACTGPRPGNPGCGSRGAS